MRRPELDAIIDTIGLFPAIQARKVAGVMFTYRCTISCRHCMFGCRSHAPDPEAVMTPAQCLEALAMLHDTGRLVHIAGGEAMLYWDVLVESVLLAEKANLSPHFVETNCSFATNDEIAYERLSFLRDHGVGGIYTSSDPYHQQFVPAESYLRVQRIAIELFGQTRYFGPDSDPERVREYERIIRDDDLLGDYVRSVAPMMVGTGQRELSCFLPPRPATAEEWDHTGCRSEFSSDGLWEIHIDPYGNILMNCGVILGHISQTTPAEVLAAGPEHLNRFTEALSTGGPFALAKIAEAEYGFTPPTEISQPCELCFLTRLHLRQFHPDIFGPAEVYD